MVMCHFYCSFVVCHLFVFFQPKPSAMFEPILSDDFTICYPTVSPALPFVKDSADLLADNILAV
jgi:hypothetical protein